MSVEMPGWGFLSVIRSARKQLGKLGWVQHSETDRIDCIQKDFGGVIIRTIGAGNKLLLSPSDLHGGYVALDSPFVALARDEIQPVVDRIARQNRKRFDKEIEEWETHFGRKFSRSKRFGV